MTLRDRIAGLVLRRAGTSRPGSHGGVRLIEAGGAEFVWIAEGDVWDVYYRVPAGRRVTMHSCSPENALTLARHIMWNWWVRGMWCGLKLRLWLWAVRVQTEHATLPKPDGTA